MKPTHILAALAAATTFAAAQGSLTPPPGVPGPVMKTLDQVEARTPLVAGQPGVTVDGVTGAITITAGGSYYLTNNLTTTGTASSINVGDHTVAIDLNGFTISRTTGTEFGSAGILISGASRQKVMIRNGFIIGGGTAGFAAAIRTLASVSGSVHVENVHVSNVRSGIILNYEEGRNSVRNCSVEYSGGQGIRAEVVVDCTVRDCIDAAIIGDSVSNCSVRQGSGFTGNGIETTYLDGEGVVANCRVQCSAGVAIQASAVMNCYADTNSNVAISANLVTSSVAARYGTAGSAISATTANGCVVIGTGTVSATNKYNMP